MEFCRDTPADTRTNSMIDPVPPAGYGQAA
jgi:hypothetical protein